MFEMVIINGINWSGKFAIEHVKLFYFFRITKLQKTKDEPVFFEDFHLVEQRIFNFTRLKWSDYTDLRVYSHFLLEAPPKKWKLRVNKWCYRLDIYCINSKFNLHGKLESIISWMLESAMKMIALVSAKIGFAIIRNRCWWKIIAFFRD